MVHCEQLLTGYFKGYGLRILRSPGLNEMLSEQSLATLLRLGSERPVITATFLWMDKCVAVSYLAPERDEQGRGCVWNHSVIAPIEPLLRAWIDKSVPSGVLHDALVYSSADDRLKNLKLEAIEV